MSDFGDYGPCEIRGAYECISDCLCYWCVVDCDTDSQGLTSDSSFVLDLYYGNSKKCLERHGYCINNNDTCNVGTTKVACREDDDFKPTFLDIIFLAFMGSCILAMIIHFLWKKYKRRCCNNRVDGLSENYVDMLEDIRTQEAQSEENTDELFNDL